MKLSLASPLHRVNNLILFQDNKLQSFSFQMSPNNKQSLKNSQQEYKLLFQMNFIFCFLKNFMKKIQDQILIEQSEDPLIMLSFDASIAKAVTVLLCPLNVPINEPSLESHILIELSASPLARSPQERGAIEETLVD